MPVVVSIEGGIGCGKSTVMRRLKEVFSDTPRVAFVDEPVDEWEAHGFLQRMYDEPASRPAFQFMALQSLASELLVALRSDPPPVLVVIERSPHGNLHTFAKANLKGADLKMFEYAWQKALKSLPVDVDMRYIHLETTVETLVARMRKRARGAESKVPVEYLTTLNDLHDRWLKNENHCHKIDANRCADAVFADVCGVIGSLADDAVAEAVRKRMSLNLMIDAAIKAKTTLAMHTPSFS